MTIALKKRLLTSYVLISLAALGVVACGGDKGSGPTPPPPPPPPAGVTTVQVAPPTASLFAADTLRLTAKALDQNGVEMSGKAVSWQSGSSTVATVAGDGLVTAIAGGSATITATIDGKSGSAVLAVRSADSLPGAPADPAVAAIPDRPFQARSEDYTTDHPDLRGVRLSFNTVTVSIAASATVADVNALLTAFAGRIVAGIPGKPAQAQGILFLRLPTKSHAELIPRLAALRQRSVVAGAVADIVLEPQVTPAANAGTPPEWQWTLAPTGGAWGPIAIRAPEMWNLNDAIRKAGSTTEVGVYDVGFANHPDLVYAANITPSAGPDVHGTHVAGTIGATFNNRLGVDGINPFATLVVETKTTAASWLSAFRDLALARPNLRVVNLSLAYNWGKQGIDTKSGLSGIAARLQADGDGATVASVLANLAAAGRPLPQLIAASGNDSDKGFGDQDAVHASPYANAALAHNAAPIIVVEAVGLLAAGSVTRASFSNLGGHVSAPGVAIQSTGLSNGYIMLNGTSMATPHVTGLVSYLYALDPALPAPTMTTNMVRDLLVATATPVFGFAAPMIDGFRAALDLDRIRGDHRTLGLLVDIDDGTPDGNTRLNADGSVNTADAKGDGAITMADFRRWRDWLLQAEQVAGLDLDGAADHPKKDLNADGVVSPSPAVEKIHPRGDLNGDGEISRVKQAKVPGVKNGQPATDLQVLQERFQDPDYQPADLPGLIDSWDLGVDPAKCVALPGALSVKTTVRVHGQTAILATRDHTTARRLRVITLPVRTGSYDVRVDALDGAGNPIASEQEQFSPAAGADLPHDPVCTGFELSVVFPGSIAAGTATPVDIKAGDRDLTTGAVTFRSGVRIDIVPAGGTVAPAAGQTNGAGQFIPIATLSQGSTLLTLAITATRADGVSATKLVSAGLLNPPPPPPQPPPPPPPPNCPDVSIDSDSSATAAAGLSCILNLAVRGFRGRITAPVALNGLTQVKEDMLVEGGIPGFSAGALTSSRFTAVRNTTKLTTLSLALTRVEDLSIDGNQDLTRISLGGATINQGLSITGNTKLTDISAISCGMRINGDLVIKDNPVLRTADAQAKAACMTVRGTTSISGNKP